MSVIIPNWNQRSLLEACLHSLSRQEFQDFETIVVDNGSSDGSVDHVARNFPLVQVLALDSNLGFAVASNSGIRMARGKYIALLNNDTEADRLWLQELVGALDSALDVGFCASKMLLWEDPSIADACGDFYTVEGIAGKIAHLSQVSSSPERKEVFGASAGAAIYRRSMLDDIELFDEDFFITHEDTDLSFRAQLMGYKCLYVPSAIVYHRLSATLGRDSDMHNFYGQRNIEFVFFRNMPLTLLIKYLPLHLITVVLLFLVYLRRGKARPFIKAKLDALRLLPRMIGRRRGIQRKRNVPAHEIDRILTKGWLMSAIRRKVNAWLRPTANTA